jgi:uncharacterized protein (DUF433 family)
MAQPLIVSDLAVMLGKPVIRGTRLTVALILEKLASGETVEQILAAHPQLTGRASRPPFNLTAPDARIER